MSRFTLLTALSIAATAVVAQLDPAVTKPLANKRIPYNQIPYKVDTDVGTVRGDQLGYNRCNATTEGQDSLCQTSMVNGPDDFCLWAPSRPNSEIANTEGEEVAWCTRPGRGTRIIPQGALTGLQFTRTPAYVQVVGYINGPLINIKKGDYGGELDPHGADLRGNPLGGLMYSNAFPSNNGNKNSYQQVIEWHNFMGDGQFCIKVCDPSNRNAAKFCQHIYDRIGCAYNAPSNARDNVFESCEGDVQDYPGIYTEDGVVKTYTQPAESLGAISTIPYQPRVPASSKCVQYQSAQLLASLVPAAPGSAGPKPTVSAASSSSIPTSLASSTASRVSSSKATVSRTSAVTLGPTPTGVNSTGNANALRVSSVVGVAGVALTLLVLA